MNTAIQCIILLACAAICTSAPIKSCRCVKMIQSVRPSHIAGVKDYGPRPYCNRQEVIVTLKDKTERCLDPTQNFTQALLQAIQTQKAARRQHTITI